MDLIEPESTHNAVFLFELAGLLKSISGSDSGKQLTLLFYKNTEVRHAERMGPTWLNKG